jgi:hypothetical protein
MPRHARKGLTGWLLSPTMRASASSRLGLLAVGDLAMYFTVALLPHVYSVPVTGLGPEPHIRVCRVVSALALSAHPG